MGKTFCEIVFCVSRVTHRRRRLCASDARRARVREEKEREKERVARRGSRTRAIGKGGGRGGRRRR